MEKKTEYTFRGWQMSQKNTVQQEISNAVSFYIQKNGFPPKILEVSDQLGNVELPEGLQIVMSAHHIPKNIFLIGVNDEETNVRMETQSEL